ncbi:MAG: hypothetical protein MUQ65_14520 [Armatimonadetes bacterium]|nr:hypothetical protein [Armatimonadota bacterium]
MAQQRRRVKIAFIGGGSQSWAPTLLRDIVMKKGMDRVDLTIYLLDLSLTRARAIKRLADTCFKQWGVTHARVVASTQADTALKGADFVILAISTGRLEAMRHDLDIPERYGVYHTVGDTAGPGGWARSIRNIPVFRDYARQIKRLAPKAYVLNYTNPMGTLTKVLADELGWSRVVGLCHSVFENYAVLQLILGLDREEDLSLRFGGLNHFFWVLDFSVRGEDGYPLLRKKLGRKPLSSAIARATKDAHGWLSGKHLASSLYEAYGYLPYLGDRHICEFFSSYMTRPELLEAFGIKRTSIADREDSYERADEEIRDWTSGKKVLDPTPSRETAADIMTAILFDRPFTDAVNMVNHGQIPNLPLGAVVETPGYVDGNGFVPLVVGPIPDQPAEVTRPHAEVQLRTVAAALAGDLEAALAALRSDPICAHLPPRDVRKMGLELLEAHREFVDLPLPK